MRRQDRPCVRTGGRQSLSGACRQRALWAETRLRILRLMGGARSARGALARGGRGVCGVDHAHMGSPLALIRSRRTPVRIAAALTQEPERCTVSEGREGGRESEEERARAVQYSDAIASLCSEAIARVRLLLAWIK